MVRFSCGCLGMLSVDPNYIIVFQACDDHGGDGEYRYQASFRENRGEGHKVLDADEEKYYLSGLQGYLRNMENVHSRFNKIRSALGLR